MLLPFALMQIGNFVTLAKRNTAITVSAITLLHSVEYLSITTTNSLSMSPYSYNAKHACLPQGLESLKSISY